jgi:hypothetical protein
VAASVVAVAGEDVRAADAKLELARVGHELHLGAGHGVADDAGAVEVPVGEGDGRRGLGGAPGRW